MLKVRPGDKLQPSPEWNSSKPRGPRLSDPTEVLAVKVGTAYTSGVAFQVALGGKPNWLDASWFLPPE